MQRRIALVLPAVLVLAGGIGLASPAEALTVPVPTPPKVMAAVGDSITRAFDVSGSYFLKDAPAESWSTGTDAAVNSQAKRLRDANPGVTISTYNDAVTGAKMGALAGQMTTAGSQGADYVTVLMGANDVCTKTTAAMTSTTDLGNQFRAGMDALIAARPNAVVFVSSIPNVYNLWSVLHTSGSARFAWAIYGVCQDMLGSSATETQRQTVLKRLQDDNAQLAALCTQTYAKNCAWDSYATYNVAFTAKQVSTVDYFHPNVSGQALLASTTWTASPYGH